MNYFWPLLFFQSLFFYRYLTLNFVRSFWGFSSAICPSKRRNRDLKSIRLVVISILGVSWTGRALGSTFLSCALNCGMPLDSLWFCSVDFGVLHFLTSSDGFIGASGLGIWNMAHRWDHFQDCRALGKSQLMVHACEDLRQNEHSLLTHLGAVFETSSGHHYLFSDVSYSMECQDGIACHRILLRK